MKNSNYTPIAIFCYNRPKHLQKLLESIKKNKNYKKHKYFFFCDGLKDKSSSKNINISSQIKKIISLFNVNKKIFYRKSNLGLSKNIIQGVTKVLKTYEKVIVLEDDLQLDVNFLAFMNKSLTKFSSNKDLGSITGFSYIHNNKLFKNIQWFKTFRHCSWSWGTWKRVWSKINWNAKIDDKSIDIMDKGGVDLKYMLLGYKYGLINSWAIRFNYHCIKESLLSVSPRYSLVKNNGFDFSGTNTFNFFKKPRISFFRKKINFNINPILNKNINLIIYNMHKKNYRLISKLIIIKVLNNFFPRKIK